MTKSEMSFLLANVWAVPGVMIGYGSSLYLSWAMVVLFLVASACFRRADGRNQQP